MKKKRKSSTTPIREEWRREHNCCMIPGCHERFGLQIHEIIGGSDRSKSIAMPATMLLLCHADHERLCSRPNQEMLVHLLAIKLWSDPENFDAAAVIRLWRPKGTSVFMGEIIDQVNEEYAKIVRNYQ